MWCPRHRFLVRCLWAQWSGTCGPRHRTAVCIGTNPGPAPQIQDTGLAPQTPDSVPAPIDAGCWSGAIGARHMVWCLCGSLSCVWAHKHQTLVRPAQVPDTGAAPQTQDTGPAPICAGHWSGAIGAGLSARCQVSQVPIKSYLWRASSKSSRRWVLQFWDSRRAWRGTAP